MSESRKELQKRLDKRWKDFVVEIVELCTKNCRVIAQLEQTLVNLKNDFNPHGLPYGYGNKRK